MKKIKRILSSLLALVMVLSLSVPAFAQPAEGADAADHKTDVVIHKMELDSLEGWPKGNGLPGDAYNGSQIEDLNDYFGTGAKELKDVTFTYWEVTEAQYKEMTANPGNFDTVAKVNEVFEGALNGKGITTGKTASPGGVTVNDLGKGYYWFVENKSTVDRDGRTVSGSAAVPFGLNLPMSKADGSQFGTGADALHVYPKNTLTDQPDVKKEIDGHTGDQAKDTRVGDDVPYTITTTIKPGAQYQTVRWSDQMTEGLTLVKDSFEVTIGGTKIDATNYDLEAHDRSFTLSLNEEGRKLVNGKDENITVTIKYKATLNQKAVVKVPESNDVMFFYGNNPSHGNTPIPTKPNPDTKELTVTKTFDVGLEKKDVEVQLINAQTGKVEETVKLTSENNYTHTFTGLDVDTEYKVIEKESGYDVVYGKGAVGEITINNKPTDNPPPINPDEPKVVTYGKKFVKTGGENERLQGAEFIITNKDNNQYLAYKSSDQTDDDLTTYNNARTAYLAAIEAYNKRASDADEKALLADTQTKFETLEAAYAKINLQYEWKSYTYDKENPDPNDINAVRITSNDDGQFEITGLPDGDYNLVETNAPIGFAKLKDPQSFKVTETSYNDKSGNIDYTPDSGKQDATAVLNKEVTIPQTGGMGTLLFVIIGLCLMGTAVYAMKKRNSKEEIA